MAAASGSADWAMTAAHVSASTPDSSGAAIGSRSAGSGPPSMPTPVISSVSFV